MKNLPSYSLIVVLMFALIFISYSCTDEQISELDEALISEYSEMAEAIATRNTKSLLNFTDHELASVRSLAWRSISKSLIDSVEQETILQRALETEKRMAWTALRHSSFSDAQLDRVHEYAAKASDLTLMCEFFFRVGNLQTLEILLSDKDLLGRDPACAKAVGGILWRVEVPDSLTELVMEIAFEIKSDEARRNLLYGFYRSDLNRPREGSSQHRLFLNLFKELNTPALMDWIYMVRIGGKEGFRLTAESLSDDELNEYVQLSNILAGSVTLFEGEELPNESVIRLLQHREEIVVAGVLKALESVEGIDSSILDLVEGSLASSTGDPHVLAHSMHLLLANDRDIFRFFSKIERMDRDSPYLTNHFLPLFDEIETSEQFSLRLKNEIEAGGIRGMHAASYLGQLSSLDDARNLFRFALNNGDVSVIRGIAGLIENPEIVRNQDFSMIREIYNRWLQQSEIDKVLELNGALNRRFQDQFESAEVKARPFRYPDWQRLNELGSRPHWILETSEGEIVIELHTEKAPFTVSSIDSLTRAGHYNGTVIHRVVPNFVIQGGDFTRRDGYGSPGYRIPTEPSFDSFERGKVGIASSGQDTEGGQFFIMHQWAPHLDGNYTIFGEVIRGMDVVDRIQVGDRVVGTELILGSLRI